MVCAIYEAMTQTTNTTLTHLYQ